VKYEYRAKVARAYGTHEFMYHETIAADMHTHPRSPKVSGYYEEIYAAPPSPGDLAAIFNNETGSVQLSLINCEGKPVEKNRQNWMLVRTLNTTDMDPEQRKDWRDRMDPQIYKRYSHLAKTISIQTPEMLDYILRKENLKFVLQAAHHHKVGLYCNDATGTRYIRYDLL
jgi:hypothetical protein